MKQLRPKHVHVATSNENLGTVYKNLGDFQHAKDSHASALDIRLKQLGPDHVDAATSYNNLIITEILEGKSVRDSNINIPVLSKNVEGLECLVKKQHRKKNGKLEFSLRLLQHN